MDAIEVSTEVRVPPEEAYEFLLDFQGYANYSKHLQSVTPRGDGGADAEYALTFTWWKLTHTVHSQVTSVDPPNEIRWALLGQFDAKGRWVVEPTDDGSRVALVVTYDADSADAGLLDLPVLVSMDWVVEKAADVTVEEGERVVERVVADLEGERRPVELTVEERYSSP